MPRKSVVHRDWDETTGILSATFADGATKDYNVFALPKPMQDMLMMHGANQKVFDTVAGMGSDGSTTEDVKNEANAAWSRLENSEWIGARGGGGGGISLAVLTEALARITKSTPERAAKVIEPLSKDQRGELAKDQDMKVAIAAIGLERAKLAQQTAQAVSSATVASVIAQLRG